jgi:cytochrome c peroxidase
MVAGIKFVVRCRSEKGSRRRTQSAVVALAIRGRNETGVCAAHATKMYRTTPLRALRQHPPYFHEGSAADLAAVVDHYNKVLRLGLKDRQKADLVEYLKTL